MSEKKNELLMKKIKKRSLIFTWVTIIAFILIVSISSLTIISLYKGLDEKVDITIRKSNERIKVHEEKITLLEKEMREAYEDLTALVEKDKSEIIKIWRFHNRIKKNKTALSKLKSDLKSNKTDISSIKQQLDESIETRLNEILTFKNNPNADWKANRKDINSIKQHLGRRSGDNNNESIETRLNEILTFKNNPNADWKANRKDINSIKQQLGERTDRINNESIESILDKITGLLDGIKKHLGEPGNTNEPEWKNIEQRLQKIQNDIIALNSIVKRTESPQTGGN